MQGTSCPFGRGHSDRAVHALCAAAAGRIRAACAGGVLGGARERHGLKCPAGTSLSFLYSLQLLAFTGSSYGGHKTRPLVNVFFCIHRSPVKPCNSQREVLRIMREVRGQSAGCGASAGIFIKSAGQVRGVREVREKCGVTCLQHLPPRRAAGAVQR
eukprot:gene14175-biopygen5096